MPFIRLVLLLAVAAPGLLVGGRGRSIPLVGEDRTDSAFAQTGPGRRRYTVAEAAEALGITAEAARTRIRRGTLESVKEGGKVYVLLSPDQTPPGH
jgi:hypothetical protein